MKRSGNAAEVAGRLATRLAARAPHPAVIFLDGRSGSGKTSLATALGAELALRGMAPQLLGMDELYPGWDGLAAGSAALPTVLRSHRYRRYDWAGRCFGAERTLTGGTPLLVEGCGAVSAAALRAGETWGSVYAVWIECPAPLRRERALARDGDMFAPHWEAWAKQETAHFAQARPIAHVDEIVHGA